MPESHFLLDLATNAPVAGALIYMVTKFAKYMNEQRDFFFGKDGYVTKRDEAFTKMMKEVADSQNETASKLHSLCLYRGNVR